MTQTGYTYGRQRALDVRTKGLYVLKIQQGKHTISSVVQETGFRPTTVRRWVKQLGPRIDEALECPIGVPYLVATPFRWAIRGLDTQGATNAGLVAQLLGGG